jgi:hypothetical protein
MVDISGLPPTLEAGTLIGTVLLEAVVLYLGYGVAEELFGDSVVERIQK